MQAKPAMSEIKKKAGVRVSVMVREEDYQRLMTLKGRLRRPTTELVGEWVREGLAREEAKLSQQ